MMTDSDIDARVGDGKRLYAQGLYNECVSKLEDLLSDSLSEKGQKYSAEVHLLLAKCHKGSGDLKSAIEACNSALELRPRWKDPFLVRSSCFQSLHSILTTTSGDAEDTIAKDMQEANIVVDALGQYNEKNGRVNQVHEAFAIAKEGDRIFVKAGEYVISPLPTTAKNQSFLFGKNVSLIGQSSKDCKLIYGGSTSAQRLQTMIICGTGTTLIKRFTFRCQDPGDHAKTRYLGVAGGTVQLEDCVFEGNVPHHDLDAIYVSSRISSGNQFKFPAPSVIVRHCVFDSLGSHGALTVARGVGNIRNCYFVGQSGVVAMDSAKVKVENCEFSGKGNKKQTVSGSNTDITVFGCYMHEEAGTLSEDKSAIAGLAEISVTVKSVASINNNYIFGRCRGGNGISCSDSEVSMKNNLIINCTRQNVSNGLQTGVYVVNPSKVQVVSNTIQRCDVGVYIGKDATPVVRDNIVESCHFTGMFAEAGAKPNVFANVLSSHRKGFGMVWLNKACGIIGKNTFTGFDVSPVMVFSQCHPLVKDNTFEEVFVDDDKQEILEKTMLEHFSADLFQKDHYFYMVDSQANEKALQEVILMGP